jgi:hypothetical protein
MFKHLQPLLEENGYSLSPDFAEIYLQMMPEGPWEGGIAPIKLRYLVFKVDEANIICPVSGVPLDDSTGDEDEYQEFLTRLPAQECRIFIVYLPELATFGPLEGIYIPEVADEDEKKRYSHFILDFLTQIAVRGNRVEDFQKAVFAQRVQRSIDAEMDDVEDFED